MTQAIRLVPVTTQQELRTYVLLPEIINTRPNFVPPVWSDEFSFHDPKKNPDAVRYQKLTFDEAINKNLKVMDATAFTLCRDQNLQINVFSIFKAGGLKRVVTGEDEGTVVHG